MSGKADRVMLDGKIVTVDRDFSIHEAVAIRGARAPWAPPRRSRG